MDPPTGKPMSEPAAVIIGVALVWHMIWHLVEALRSEHNDGYIPQPEP